MTSASLRSLWNDGRETLGGWLSIPGPMSAEAMARAGFDYLCIDTQHGAIEYSDVVEMIPAILLGGSRPIVRVPWNDPGIIGKMLDAGAQGVVVPMIDTAADAEAVVRACRYPPHGGARSWGPGLAAPRIDGHYLDWAEHHVAVIPMIETADGLANLDDIVAVDGVDAVYVGPADLSLALGLRPQNNDGDESFDGALAQVVAACDRAGVVPGAHAVGGVAPARRRAGFRMMTVSHDILALGAGADADQDVARGVAGAD